MDIPHTKKEGLFDEIHGIKIADPYRWLENSKDPEVQDWIKSQNQYTESILKDRATRLFSEELVKNFKVINYFNPVPVAGKYFYRERQPDEDQAVLYVKTGLEGTPVKLFDPNGLKDGNTITIDFWNQSKNGKYVAYGISEGGNEMATIYVKEVETNKELPDKIVNCRHSRIRWLPDESSFFYTRSPRPGTVPKSEEHLHEKVYYHKLGTDPEADPMIFGQDRPKDDMIELSLSVDGKFLAISVSKTWTQNEIYIYDRDKNSLSPLITGIPSEFSIIFLDDKVLIKTNYKANNQRILWAKLDDFQKPIDDWQELISERAYSLESLLVTKSKILLEYLVNACSKVIIFDHNGKEIGELPLPAFSNLSGLSGRKNEEEFFYGVDSFACPRTIYYYNPAKQDYSIYRKMDNPLNPDQYETRQEWFLSKDRTKVPMFIFYKKGLRLDGSNPTILYGYGGFGSVETPIFNRNLVPWVERGGIFAIANIRGGGEFGDQWHKQGIKENKQNSFDDFIAAAEHLIDKKYTKPDHLGIMGGSNGGLLVSAVAMERPELFKAACAKVPLTDMLRFPKFGMALRWIHEYGDPEIKEDFERIMKWSPYHNVKAGMTYPNFLFTTATNDTRVAPLHAYKMAALLQSVNKDRETMVLTEIDAGHGMGRPISKIVENQSLVLSFFTKFLSLKLD